MGKSMRIRKLCKGEAQLNRWQWPFRWPLLGADGKKRGEDVGDADEDALCMMREV